MNRHIRRVTVLGSGVMGSGIACHLAGIGVQVSLLDMPTEGADSILIMPSNPILPRFMTKLLLHELPWGIL